MVYDADMENILDNCTGKPVYVRICPRGVEAVFTNVLFFVN